MSTALTQLYYHTMARPRVVSEKESLLEGESGPTPAEKTLPTPCQQDRSWPSLEDGERRPVQAKFPVGRHRETGGSCRDGSVLVGNTLNTVIDRVNPKYLCPYSYTSFDALI